MRRLLLFLLLLLSVPCLAQSPSPTPDTAQVVVDGLPLITLNGSGDLSAAERAKVLHDRLEQVLSRDPVTPTVTVSVMHGMPALISDNIPLISVTTEDADAQHTDQVTLSAEWRDTLEHGLRQIAAERNGRYLNTAVAWSAGALVLALILQFSLQWAAHRYHLLRTPGWSLYAAIWLAAVSFMMEQFPVTRTWGNLLGNTVLWPLTLLLLVLLAATLAWRFCVFIVDRYFTEMEHLQSEAAVTNPRLKRRLLMLRQVTRVVMNLVLVVVTVMAYLTLLRINVAALVAGASVIGVALGFATQDMLKDMAAGLNVVLEDQFGVGDWIKTADKEGAVVGFTLRATQLRTIDGHLTTIPNAALRIVENVSTGHCKVDLRVNLSYDADIRQALDGLKTLGHEVKEAFPVDVIDEPEVLGVDTLGPAVTLRMLLHTTPAGLTPVKSELLIRAKERFGDAKLLQAQQPQSVVSLPASGPAS